MARKRRSRKSKASSTIGDAAYIGARLPWWGALLFGATTFVLFYFLVPGYLEGIVSGTEGRPVHAGLEVIAGRRSYLFKWVALASLLLGIYFSVRNYFLAKQARGTEIKWVTFLSKLLGRSID